jgi:thiosulfate/3-mercaptopyruvate sulfurtransferase
LPYTTLISVAELRHDLTNFLVIDCRFSLANTHLGEQQYQQGHIPGARYAHLDQHLSSPITPTSGRHPLPNFDQLIAQIKAWGINNHSQVIAYDDANGAYASRLWWLLRTLGHTEVAVLEGGIQAWLAAGLALESGFPESQNGNFEGRLDRQAWWDIDELQQHLTAKDGVLIDARAKERFDGISEPIDPVAGHIPGSVNRFIGDNLDSNGFFLDADKLREQYQQLIGNTDPSQVIHSCGSGVFACFGILSMEIAGLKGSKLYPGSWSEWILDPARGVGPARPA